MVVTWKHWEQKGPWEVPSHGLLGLGIADATLGSNGEKLLLLERGDDLLHLGGLDAAIELKHRLDGPNWSAPEV